MHAVRDLGRAWMKGGKRAVGMTMVAGGVVLWVGAMLVVLTGESRTHISSDSSELWVEFLTEPMTYALLLPVVLALAGGRVWHVANTGDAFWRGRSTMTAADRDSRPTTTEALLGLHREKHPGLLAITLLEPVDRPDEVERLLAPRLGGEHARQVLEALPAVIGWATFEDAALIRRAFEDVGARVAVGL